MISGKWNSVYYKQSKNDMETFIIHKLAPAESTYSYCVRNIDNNRIKLQVDIKSGL